MKRITIDIFGEEDGSLNGMVDIESDDLCITYSNACGGHGLQCNFTGDMKEHNDIQERCYQINKLVRELNEIYK